MHVKSLQLCPTLCNPMGWSLLGSSVHGDSPGKKTGVGGHTLLQGIFPTQGLNTGLLHCRWILYPLSHQGSPYTHIQNLYLKIITSLILCSFPGGSDGKKSAYNAGEPVSVPGSGRSPGEGNGNPLQYSCLENSMDGEPGRIQCMGLQRV